MQGRPPKLVSSAKQRCLRQPLAQDMLLEGGVTKSYTWIPPVPSAELVFYADNVLKESATSFPASVTSITREIKQPDHQRVFPLKRDKPPNPAPPSLPDNGMHSWILIQHFITCLFPATYIPAYARKAGMSVCKCPVYWHWNKMRWRAVWGCLEILRFYYGWDLCKLKQVSTYCWLGEINKSSFAFIKLRPSIIPRWVCR